VLVVYGLWIYDYLRTAPPVEGEPPSGGPPLRTSIALLALGGVGAAFVSEWFIDALRPSIDELGVSSQFAGLVIVAIAGNAVEHAVGVVLAAKGQADLAISVVKNSVAQVAAFLMPALVLVSLLFADRLTFDLAPVYIAALALTILSVWQVTGDGEARYSRGRR
jgi:Ca2+:H+ antiporter